jgi:hypothetical protein
MTTKPSHLPTQPSRIWRHKVKRTLEAVRRKYNITGRFTDADFYRICRAENIWLMNGEGCRNLLEFKKLYGVCARDKSGQYVIYLRSFFSRNRKLCMFTAGHELGHFFLGHVDTNLKASLGWTPNEQFEREADYFARFALKMEVENAAN